MPQHLGLEEEDDEEEMDDEEGIDVDISDEGASDGSVHTKKKKRRVLFSKVIQRNLQ